MNSGRGSSQGQSSPKGQGFGGKEIPALRIQPETPCPPSNNATPVPVSVPNGTPTEKERNFSLPALPLHHKPLQKHNSRPFPNPSGPTRITTDNVHLKGKKEMVFGSSCMNPGQASHGPMSSQIPSPRLDPLPTSSASYHPHSMSHQHPQQSQGSILRNMPLPPPPSLNLPAASPAPSDISSIRMTPRDPHGHHMMSREGSITRSSSESVKGAFLGPVSIKQEWSRGPALLTPASGHGSLGSELGDNYYLPPGSSMSHYATSSNSLSPFPIPDFPSPGGSSFASPRHSARSSLSGRGRKRALSLSPLSNEGLDLNMIIRTSPTSLVAYINGSRGSSASASPQPGIPPGGYGHLVARTNLSSPQSHSSGNTRSYFTTTPLSHASLPNGHRHSDEVFDGSRMEYLRMQRLEQANGQYGGHEMQNRMVVTHQQDALTADQNMQIFKTEPIDYNYPPTSDSLAMPPPPPPPYNQHHRISQPALQHGDESPRDAGLEYDDDDGDSPIICRWIDCNMTFTEQEELVRHIEKVHIDQRKGEDFTCFWAGCPRRYKPFNARYKLLIHMRVHSGEKPNKCTFEGCNKAFSRLENLKIHLRSHTGEKPYLCQHAGCQKAFSNSSDRAKHQRTHLDTKPYACQIPGCTKRYTDPSSLRKHVKAHTAKEQQARKKLRANNMEGELSSEVMLSECLTIQPIHPVGHGDRSPLGGSTCDSSLGHSPHSSMPGTSSDMYQGMYGSTHSSRSGTATGASNHSSHPSPANNTPVHSMSPLGPPPQMPSMDERERGMGHFSPSSHHPPHHPHSQARRMPPPSMLPPRRPQLPPQPPPQIQASIFIQGYHGNTSQSFPTHLGHAPVHGEPERHSLPPVRHHSPRNLMAIPTFEETLTPATATFDQLQRAFSARSGMSGGYEMPATPSIRSHASDEGSFLQLNAVDRCYSRQSAVYADGSS
ncbi:GLIS1 [Branchiostoma lanceolatum]|uniref:GLIS1 protein n=1 Tax=Branchiostoma lanceolatum TaxID=7740 RepID=A0A8J9YY70_BRALA|nr:GLIS1 [Branchiostoma lanceolatum]